MGDRPTLDLIEQIAAAVAMRVRIPLQVELWASDDIAAYLKLSHRQVSERIVCLPGFPQAIRLPSGKTGHGQPRWKAAEVIAWVEKFQEKRIA